MALSQRGDALAKVPFDHGQLNEYDEISNPTGVVNLLFAENVCWIDVSLRSTEADSDRDSCTENLATSSTTT